MGLQKRLAEAGNSFHILQTDYCQLEEQYKELGTRMVGYRRQKAYQDFREFFRIARAGLFTATFYKWQSITADGQLARGASELHDIVEGAKDASPKGGAREDWEINALDI